MKKVMLMAVAALMATMTVQAQNEDLKNEIGVSYGLGVSTIGDGLGNGIGTGLGNIFGNMLGYRYDNESRFGSLSVEYFRHLNSTPKLAFGGIFSYSRYGEDALKDDTKIGDRSRNYFTLMPAMKYAWINKHHFALYSKLAVGATLMSFKVTENGKSESESKLYFMGQVSAIGVEFGSKLRGFVEVGAGEQGIVLGGIKYKF